MHDPDTLVPVTTAATEFEGGTIVAVLEAEGIAARQVSGVQTLLGLPALGLGDPIKILVRAGDLAKAREALERNREDSVDLDWSGVDVGAPEPFAPARPGPRPSMWRTAIGIILLLVLAVAVSRVVGGLMPAL